MRPSGAARLELLTRSGCHLCDDMRQVLDAVLPDLGQSYEVVDVDANVELLTRYGDTVPVLLRDGRPVAKIRLEERQLRRIVRGRRFSRP